MADEKKSTTTASGKVFTSGVNLAPVEGSQKERRYEAGDPVPADLTKAEMKALIEMQAIGDK